MKLKYFLTFIIVFRTIESENVSSRRLKRIANASSKIKDEEFLIYRYIFNRQGYCLEAEKTNNELIRVILNYLCLKGNPAARWIHLKGYLFQNVKFYQCLTASRNLDGSINGQLILQPCDSQNRFQKWQCNANCHVSLEKTFNSGKYNLDHKEKNVKNIVVAVPLLRLGYNYPSAKWIIHDQRNDLSQCICSALAVELSLNSKIITVTGSKGRGKAGQLCVFPFISKGRDVWQCIPAAEKGKHFCGTVRNLDENRKSWGICPEEKRGTFSEWLRPVMCDRACGGGRIIQHRKCLYPPCNGPFEGVQEGSCNTQLCSGDYILTAGGQSAVLPLDGFLPLRSRGPIGVCKFPFIIDQRSAETCISDHRREQAWCSLTHNYDRHRMWGYCLGATLHMWSSWTSDDESSCSRSCGGGNILKTRKCRQPPCNGRAELSGKSCNTHPCPDCYNGRGQHYQGEKNVANDGTLCLRWSMISSNFLRRVNPQHYRSVNHNFCRNPGGVERFPYCVVEGRNIKIKKICDLVPCQTKISGLGITYTIPLGLYDQDPIAMPCRFPYFYRNVFYDSCLLLSNANIGNEQCEVDSSNIAKFRFCPSYFRGKWSLWEFGGDCTKSCDGGFQIMFRRCLFPPCVGTSIQIIKSKKCNTQPCAWTQVGSADCFIGRGLLYEGTTSKTIIGERCRNWGTKFPELPYIYNTILPKSFPRLVENHCRNPMPHTYLGPWCYTNSGWQYCDVPRCPTREGEIFPVPFPTISKLQHSNQSCQFPFVGADNKLHNNCIPVLGRLSLKYCATKFPDNVDFKLANPIEPFKHLSPTARARAENQIRTAYSQGLSKLFFICPSSVKGTWSSWSSTEKCSVDCGGGIMIRTRHCLYPPCREGKITVETNSNEPCNQHDCPVCLKGSGQWYRGKVNEGYRGNKCMKWSVLNQYMTNFYPEKYKELNENYCRNPDGLYPIPWCYIRKSKSDVFTRVFCDIPHCNDDTLETIPFTIPDYHFGYSRKGGPCEFPYKFGDEWYSSCFNNMQNQSNFFCPVTKIPTDDLAFLAICPPHYRGKWTKWIHNGTCRKPCGESEKLFVRDCLYPPCIGSRFKFSGTCSLSRCTAEVEQILNINCFIGSGKSYIGNVSRPVSARNCISWNAPYLKHRYSNIGAQLVDNFCRNPSPGSFRIAPWCFVYADNQQKRWSYCDIRKCTKYAGEILTLGGNAVGRPCYFPFIFEGSQRESCLEFTDNLIVNGGATFRGTKYLCATASRQTLQPRNRNLKNWGLCPTSYRGTISSWTLMRGENFCSKKCGGGKYVFKKRCRFEPCVRNVIYTKFGDPCNTKGCHDNCVVGNGVSYSGTATWLWREEKCKKWKFFNLTQFEHGDAVFNADHNFCRNIAPSRFRMPFCMISDTQFAVCDIPLCNVTDFIPTVGLGSYGIPCQFPYQYFNKLTESCFQLYSHSYLYCFVGSNEPRMCSKHSQGTWGKWSSTERCSKPCGRGKMVYRRVCLYKRCRGIFLKEEGICNDFPCDKRKNCYDARTKGAEFRSNAAEYTRGYNCIKNNGFSCQNNLQNIARPFCRVNINGRISKKFCQVRPCPGSVHGPIMVQPILDFEERPFSPCIFPFTYNKVKYYQCLSERAVSPPTPRGNRSKESHRWCATIDNVIYDSKEWGYCLSIDRGKWSSWFSDGEHCAGSCLTFEIRYCVFSYCEGNNWRFSFKRCNHPKCTNFVWGDWTGWSSCKKCSRVKTRYRLCLDSQRGFIQSPDEAKKRCQGYSAQIGVCKDSLQHDCAHLFVNGQIDKTEVTSLLEIYNKRKESENSSNTIFCECSVLFFISIFVAVWRLFL